MAVSTPTLNAVQLEAVKFDDKRLLVLAGAGSGKTKTLLEKIIYLVKEKGIPSSRILAITFTKNAANEMTDRLLVGADESGDFARIITDKFKSQQEKQTARFEYSKKFPWIGRLTIKTFHSFCYQLMRSRGVSEFDNKFKIISEDKAKDELARYTAPETIYDVFRSLVVEQCENPEYLLGLKRYILDYLVDKIHRRPNVAATKDGKYYTSLNGVRVRSKSEQLIADWLFRHNINFVYEPDLAVTPDFSFKPDFFVPDANTYIEHVSNRSVAMKDKEEQFEKGKLLLVKTFETMTKDSSVINGALDRVVRGRLRKVPLTRYLSYQEEFGGYMEFVADFVTQAMRVTDMVKVDNLDVDEIERKALEDQHERVQDFYKLALPLIRGYQAYCTRKSYLDFNDLISASIMVLRNKPEIAAKYREDFKYVLVDEFQDVNRLQVELLKLLITDQTQLFCVGDDWQSIYGFRGSDVSFIIDFEKHFKDAKVLKFDLNYRSTQHIVGASNEVIKNNKNRVDKLINAVKNSNQKIVVYSGSNEDDNVQFCLDTIRRLGAEGLRQEDVLFLYRRTDMFRSYSKRLKEEKVYVTPRTIHSAKGLEARAVFIIGLTEGSGGFPDIWLEDRIFQVVRKGWLDLLMEEERRLFYVALTRAKERLYLITEHGCESPFLREIPEIYTVKDGTVEIAISAEEGETCGKCGNRVESKLHKFCPYCGNRISIE